nr:CopD family protein [Chloroflexota bacterium]
YGIVLTGCGWWWPRRHPIAAALGLTLAAGTPLTFSLIAHAQAQPVGRSFAVAADALHLLAASLWAGGLFVLIGVLPRTVRRIDANQRRALLAQIVPRFSLLALIAWAVMGLTGFYNAWLQVGNLTALRQTAYGQALSVKLFLLVPILALAAFNLFVVTRKLRHVDGPPFWSRRFQLAVGAEAVLVVIVLLVVGRLTGLQPARDELASGADQISIDFTAEERSASLILAPGAAGRNHFRLDVPGETLPADTEALLRLSLPSQETGTKEVTLARATGNAFEHHGAELSISGDWEATLILRQPDQAAWNATAPIALESSPPQVALPGEPWRFTPLGGLTGLALLVLGCVGLLAAWQAGRTPFRRESAGLGVVAVLLGLVLLIQARIDPVDASLATADPVLTAADGAALTRGADLYRAHCLSCHGVGLRGDGPAGVGLNPAPADFTSLHLLVHTDQDLSYWIAQGKQGTGMPAFGDILTAAEIGDLVAYVRSAQTGPVRPRDVPTAAECTIAPRTLAELAALAETPTAASATMVPAVASPLAPPAAALVDRAVGAAVRETVRGLIACSNARDTLRRLAYFSVANLRPAFAKGPSASFAQLVATPAIPLPDPLQMAIVRIEEITPLVDGRISARVVIDNPAGHSHSALAPGTPISQASEQVALFILVQDGQRWLIDEVR